MFTVYGDTVAAVDSAIETLTAADAVYTVAEMVRDHRSRVSRPGNATRELLVDHDGTTQISDEFTDRGFVPAAPVDTRQNTEHWTVLTHHPRERIDSLLEAIRETSDASISVTSIAEAPGVGDSTPVPVDRLSSRQREIYDIARASGYYDHPRRASAGELAAELGISTSTLHEHLRKVESKLLGEMK
jgi:predicted DNA binding protein